MRQSKSSGGVSATRVHSITMRPSYGRSGIAAVSQGSSSSSVGLSLVCVPAPSETARLRMSRHPFPEPSPTGPARSVPPELAAAFAILRRARERTDELPTLAASSVRTPGDLHYGVNPELSRLAGRPGGSPVWLVPGTYGCSLGVTDSGGGVGAPNERIVEQGAVVMLIPAVPGERAPRRDAEKTFVGVLPDGATVSAKKADGSGVEVTTSGAAFRVDCAVTLTIRTKTGANHTIPEP